MTDKLFYSKEYERADSFTAQVVSIDIAAAADAASKECDPEDVSAVDQTVVDIVLDRTLFFPEEGGQESDRGYLFAGDILSERTQSAERGDSECQLMAMDFNAKCDELIGVLCLEVLHVGLKNGVITHRCKPVHYLKTENEPASEECTDLVKSLREGAALSGFIDTAHRLDQMQQHTAEHIISGLVHAAYGYDNVGFHLSERSVTMDYDGVLTAAQVAEIEKKANEVVWQNIPVRVFFPTNDELKNISYRSKKEIEGDALRLVEVPGVDLCACCAPHVERTGEIGCIKVIRLQNYKGGVRLSIVCGGRALAQFSESFDMLQSLAVSLSTSVENIPDRFAAMQAEIGSLKEEVVAFRKEKAGSLQDAAIVDGEHAVLIVGKEYKGEARNIVNKLMKLHTGYCAVFAGDIDSGYFYCLGSASKDAKTAQAGLQNLYAAKGGGNAQMVQGSIPAGTELDGFSWQNLLDVE